jgi:hypothetical protein
MYYYLLKCTTVTLAVVMQEKSHHYIFMTSNRPMRFNILRADVQSYLVRAREFRHVRHNFMLCSILLDLCLKFTLIFLWHQILSNCEQWKVVRNYLRGPNFSLQILPRDRWALLIHSRSKSYSCLTIISKFSSILNLQIMWKWVVNVKRKTNRRGDVNAIHILDLQNRIDLNTEFLKWLSRF